MFIIPSDEVRACVCSFNEETHYSIIIVRLFVVNIWCLVYLCGYVFDEHKRNS